MKIGLAAVLVFTQVTSLGAQAARTTPARGGVKQDVDVVVERAARKFMSDARAVGLSVGVLKGGKTYTYNYGEVEKGKGRLPTRHTLYEIGSVTKTLTGVLLARAAVEGRVKLDDDVRKYLDGDYPNLEFDGRPVRLVHLINHTSRTSRSRRSRKRRDGGRGIFAG